MRIKAHVVIGVTVIAMLAATAIQARAQNQARVGTLDCDLSPSVGMVIGSRKEMKCIFTPVNNAPREAYVGSISRLGLDVGVTAGGKLVWGVFAPSDLPNAALAGDYVGASGEASVGAGVGANVLVGGSDRTVSLQPLSVQGQAGVNLAVGVAGMELRPVR